MVLCARALARSAADPPIIAPCRRPPLPAALDRRGAQCVLHVKDATGQALGYFHFEDEPALPRPAVVWTLTN